MQLDNGVTVFHKTDSIKSDTLKYSIPAYADILVAYSTYDGMYRCICKYRDYRIFIYFSIICKCRQRMINIKKLEVCKRVYRVCKTLAIIYRKVDGTKLSRRVLYYFAIFAIINKILIIKNHH